MNVMRRKFVETKIKKRTVMKNLIVLIALSGVTFLSAQDRYTAGDGKGLWVLERSKNSGGIQSF